MRNKLNVFLPEEHRVFTGIAPVPVHAVRVIATTKQNLKAAACYVANEKRDGCFKVDEQTYCLIESEISSFWELTPVIKDKEAARD
jgi:hypothetical protein